MILFDIDKTCYDAGLANITNIRRFTICNLSQLTTIILNSKIDTFEEQWLLSCPRVSILKYADTVENQSSNFIVVNNSVCRFVYLASEIIDLFLNPRNLFLNIINPHNI